jgi:hypothetical protein
VDVVEGEKVIRLSRTKGTLQGGRKGRVRSEYDTPLQGSFVTVQLTLVNPKGKAAPVRIVSDARKVEKASCSLTKSTVFDYSFEVEDLELFIEALISISSSFDSTEDRRELRDR